SPAVSYPVPSYKDPIPDTGNLGQFKITTIGFLYTAGTAGVTWAQIGSPGGAPGVYVYSTPMVRDDIGDTPFSVDWSGIDPGTSHWRVCYTPDGGATACGSDQQFTIPNPNNITLPDTSIPTGPPATTTSKT